MEIKRDSTRRLMGTTVLTLPPGTSPVRTFGRIVENPELQIG